MDSVHFRDRRGGDCEGTGGDGEGNGVRGGLGIALRAIPNFRTLIPNPVLPVPLRHRDVT